MKINKYVQFGCGLSAPIEWVNYDSSLTLRLSKIPVVNLLLKIKKTLPIFPKNVKYGNIINGLPEKSNSCIGLYCSHVLEHLALVDFKKALRNSYEIIQTGGIFRLVVPDLELYAREYIQSLDAGDINANLKFMGSDTLLGHKYRHKGLEAYLRSILGGSSHLWMWDYLSIERELKNAGFIKIRKCIFNDCEDKIFNKVESKDRFYRALAIECRK